MNTLTLGLFGFGCVGKGLYDVLERTHGLRATIKHIVVKDRTKVRPLPQERFSFDPSLILDDPEVNVVVELIDDADAAYHIVRKALLNGKAVVTANKRMIATHFQDLLDLQRITGQPLLYEASTCGSIPIIRNLEEYYDNDLLSGVEGIVNGTTNFILTRLAEYGSVTYADALVQAQQRGFAESDPTLDVEAWDAAFKTVVISAHAFGVVVKPGDVIRRGITTITPFDVDVATRHGWTVKLIASASSENGAITATALPTFVPKGHPLSTIDNETNAVRLHGAFADDQLLVGKGAGAHPTAAAVLSDIAALRYAYRYEYKKLEQIDAPLTLDATRTVTIYARGTDASLDSIPWLTVDVDHKSLNGRYVIGRVQLGDLSRTDAFSDSDTFLAVIHQ
ncbi:MAG: homoserine dehydrogenase [Ignavibacteriae bacterium]|nr:MAG: homoserine dehydrogenase [Ignavibacteriota bacterium]